ncbi:MAG: DUF5018 domain-containing protein [Candidatus Cryptobacteroides sp.]
MKKIFQYIALAALILGASACQQPEYKIPEKASNAITSFKAYFIGDNSEQNEFSSEIDYENHVITVVFPYTYPANTIYNLEEADLRKVKVVAGLNDNCRIDPPIKVMDLSVDNTITVINERKEAVDYVVRGEIRKSNKCFVEEFKLLTDNLTGVINDTDGTISIVSGGGLSSQLAEVKLSFGATIIGDVNPTTTEFDYSSDVTFTVQAQNGVTTKDYTVKIQLPATLEKGMRPGSAKMLWDIKLKETYSLTTPLMMTSMAVIKDYIVLNTRAEDLLVINRKDGSKVGTIELPFKGSTTNFKITGDSSDNILVCGISSTEAKVYRIKGINGTPEEYINYTETGGKSYGRGISVVGSLDGDAIITMPRYQDTWSFLRWTVTGGVLNPTPELVNIDCDINKGGWVYNCDIVPLSATDPNADYIINSYAKLVGNEANVDRASVWINGNTNTTKCHSSFTSSNWVRNAGDYVKFNGVDFYVANSVNSFTWGSDDYIYLFDLGDGNLDNEVWRCDRGTYGSFVTIGEANGNACSDVALRVSDDGYFMYLYFFFGGGHIVCVQFDCLDM